MTKESKEKTRRRKESDSQKEGGVIKFVSSYIVPWLTRHVMFRCLIAVDREQGWPRSPCSYYSINCDAIPHPSETTDTRARQFICIR